MFLRYDAGGGDGGEGLLVEITLLIALGHGSIKSIFQSIPALQGSMHFLEGNLYANICMQLL